MKHGSIGILAGAAFAFALATTDANAETIIRSPGDHPDYKLEFEPHGLLGWGGVYAGSGFGLGARFSIPIVQNGFIPSINNSVAISFGLDWIRYSGCYTHIGGTDYGCGASVLLFPVAMQWNFWLTPQWSVFGEPGLFIYHAFLNNDYCQNVKGPCGYATATSVEPALYIGGRFHFNDKVSLTMRIGYPSISVGASIFF